MVLVVPRVVAEAALVGLGGADVPGGVVEADAAVPQAEVDDARLVDLVGDPVERLQQADQLRRAVRGQRRLDLQQRRRERVRVS